MYYAIVFLLRNVAVMNLFELLSCMMRFDFQSGNAEELPTSKVMEKQKVMLEELHHKLDLNLDNFDKLNAEELKEIVDRAVGSVSERNKTGMRFSHHLVDCGHLKRSGDQSSDPQIV